KGLKCKLNAKSQIEKYEKWCTNQPNPCILMRGKYSESLKVLKNDIKNVFQPLTLIKSESFSQLSFKKIAESLSVVKATHLMVLSDGLDCPILRVARSPAGPTITFRIKNHAVSQDVRFMKPDASLEAKHFFTTSHPFLITSNFNSELGHLKIASVLLQNMFPIFDIEESELKLFKRCAIFNYNEETQDIDFRHYLKKYFSSIIKTPLSSNDSISKLSGSGLIKMTDISDISDFVLKSSENNDKNENLLSNNSTSTFESKYSLRLKEIGPRMKMEIMKIEEDFFDGKVLYHNEIKKSAKEMHKQEVGLSEKK
ncbi:MAG: hypothetical protein MHPSP_001894, partial [Paramarteilia canceri]